MANTSPPSASHTPEFRAILLTHGGSELALRELLQLEGACVAGIFIEPQQAKQFGTGEKVRRSIRYDGYAATLAKFVNPQKLARKFVKADSKSNGGSKNICEDVVALARQHDIPVHFVSNYHTDEAQSLMREAEADLGVVYGTNILRESVFGIPRLGSINVHQGLVPYYRGGPVMFWELFNDEREVGITVHFVHAKVDTGEVVLQERVPFTYDFAYKLDYERFISDFRHQHMRELSARLVARAVKQIADGTAHTWAQDLSLGKRYRLPIKAEKDEMRRRLKARMKLFATEDMRGRDTNRQPLEGGGSVES